MGRSVAGLSTKIHVLVDGLGNGIAIQLEPGNLHDSTNALELLEPIAGQINTEKVNIIADKAYNSRKIMGFVVENGGTTTIPPKHNQIDPWEIDKHTYKERHLIECFISYLKEFRRIATRYDCLASIFTAFIMIRMIMHITR